LRSVTSRRFREEYAALPEAVRQQARVAWALFKRNQSHPSLKFKRVRGHESIYSARVGLGYRVLGRVEGTDIIWFWIGAHAEYDKLIG
jgi:hypothetical protein